MAKTIPTGDTVMRLLGASWLKTRARVLECPFAKTMLTADTSSTLPG